MPLEAYNETINSNPGIVPMPKKTLRERIADADAFANRWLADGNEAAEAGNRDKAEVCYAKSQFWVDRYNLLTGRGDKPGPKS